MTTPRRSQLFHAIVVAGVGLVGGCSPSSPLAPDGSTDATAEVATDGGTDGNGDRFEANGDAATTDARSNDAATCMCSVNGGVGCQVCGCGCFNSPDANAACYPCYV